MRDVDRRIDLFLTRAISPGFADADDVRGELRAHIDAITEEAMLGGTPRDQAVAEAIAAMGPPALLARAR